MIKKWCTRGNGAFESNQFKEIGSNIIFEDGVRVFHPESIELGDNIYVGHNTILQGYYKNLMKIGTNTFIGPNCFFHSAGNITIGENVGLAAYVKILTSYHKDNGIEIPLSFGKVVFEEVIIEDEVHVGIGSIILPGVSIGKGAQIGAGAVVTKSIPDFAVAIGVPARVVRFRT